MITVKVLGGLKQILGSERIQISEEYLPKDEVLNRLQALAAPGEVALLGKGNVILMINGSEASVSNKTVVEDSDEIVVIPVAHGGKGSTASEF
jgi:molybdopterin converting factor small subunit